MLSAYQRATFRGIDLQIEEKNKVEAAKRKNYDEKIGEQKEFLSTVSQTFVKNNEFKNIYEASTNFGCKNLSSLKVDAKKENTSAAANVVPKFKVSSQVRFQEGVTKKRAAPVAIVCPPRRNTICSVVPKQKYVITSGLTSISFPPISPYLQANSGQPDNYIRKPIKIKTENVVDPSEIRVQKAENINGNLNFVVTFNDPQDKQPTSSELLKRRAELVRPYKLYTDEGISYNYIPKKKTMYMLPRKITATAAVRKEESMSAMNRDLLVDTSKENSLIEQSKVLNDKSSNKERLPLPGYTSKASEHSTLLNVDFTEVSDNSLSETVTKKNEKTLPTEIKTDEFAMTIEDSQWENKKTFDSQLPKYPSMVNEECAMIIANLPKYSAMLAEKKIISPEESSMLFESTIEVDLKTDLIVNYKFINDVVSMAGIKVDEENDFAMRNIGTKVRSCTEKPFLNLSEVISRYQSLCPNQEVEEDALKMLSYGVVDYIKSIIEKVSEEAKQTKSKNDNQSKYLDMPDTHSRKSKKLARKNKTRRRSINKLTLNDMLNVIENQKELFTDGILFKANELREEENLDF